MPTAHDGGQSQPHRLQVVLFSGGRGSGALTRQLIASPAIDLTLAINGYDDGASTGEVRRFLGNSLGPSDFRKNASTLAATLGTCPQALIELLDLRFPKDCHAADALAAIGRVDAGEARNPGSALDPTLHRAIESVPAEGSRTASQQKQRQKAHQAVEHH